MRSLLVVTLALSSAAFGQTMVESGAIAGAGSSVAGPAGKSTAAGVGKIFGKLDDQTKKAAAPKPAPKPPVRTVTKKTEPDSVPEPPPAAPARRATAAVAEAPSPRPAVQQLAPLPPPPPPPQATAADLKTVAPGTPRAELLKLGQPASKVTMFDSGHLLEIYHYTSKEATVGIVKLNDGTVASVQTF
jgi:hypothetical protein